MLGKSTPFKRRPATPKKYNIRVPLKVQKAKDFPIESLYTNELKKVGNVKMGRCPFHQEDTASLALYPETNSWFCFGACKTGGDVIKFYQRLHGCTFRVAVDELSK